jgi:alpha-tubulin suppressor-like RCC1 family protein
MALGEDGKVYVWGQNDFGLFGGTDRGPTYVRAVPAPIAGLTNVVGIVAMDHAGGALRDDGTVWMWGEDVEGIMGGGTLTKSGQNGRKQYSPARVADLDGVAQIASGSNFMLALKRDGTVWAWGANKYAQLGLGDNEARARPTRIPSLSGVTRIYADAHMSAAQQSDGSWLVWGGAPSAKPATDDGPPVMTPSPLPGVLRDAVDVTNGVAMFRDGSVRTWGGNSFGSLGTGSGVDATVAAPRAVIVRSLSGIVNVWSGNNRGVALKSDGTLLLWGPSGSENAGVFRVPTAIGMVKVDPPQ